jgi:hypothetical protein
MVLEHLDDAAESLYLQGSRERLIAGERSVLLVPGSSSGSGHRRRFRGTSAQEHEGEPREAARK